MTFLAFALLAAAVVVLGVMLSRLSERHDRLEADLRDLRAEFAASAVPLVLPSSGPPSSWVYEPEVGQFYEVPKGEPV